MTIFLKLLKYQYVQDWKCGNSEIFRIHDFFNADDLEHLTERYQSCLKFHSPIVEMPQFVALWQWQLFNSQAILKKLGLPIGKAVRTSCLRFWGEHPLVFEEKSMSQHGLSYICRNCDEKVWCHSRIFEWFD
jgi:hypothetical protein